MEFILIEERTMSANIDRRGLLHCMAWVGTGVVWAMAGGVPRSLRIEEAGRANSF